MPPAFTLSQDQTLRFISAPTSLPGDMTPEGTTAEASTNRPELMVLPRSVTMNATMPKSEQPSKRTVTHQRRYAPDALKAEPANPSATHPDHRSGRSISPALARGNPRAPPTYPFLAYATVKDRSKDA